MAPFDRSHTSCYSSSIVNMSLSSTVTEIFSVVYWRDLEIWVRSRSRSLKMAPIDRSSTTFYWSAIVSIALSCTSFELLNVQDIVTSNLGYGRIFHRFRNKARYWSKNARLLNHLVFNLHNHLEIGIFFLKLFTQTAEVPELLGGAKILAKSSTLCVGSTNVTDD